MLAQHTGINSLTIQTDCLQAIQTMNDGGFLAKSADTVYADCNILLSGFDNVLVEHCKTEAYKVAHELARNASSLTDTCIWDHNPPSSIFESCER